ncbi:Alpha/Beta hydrolase protein [Aspergillus minisclerotigenes]|uniref:Carboxylic ester hydrolase n=1 Tax=Aspergillus minisclerotigenes TaxID=656917 RepID=A0A5N6JB46_9EURO|nr:Alpha/Beta hydrolase protein [Aspergillus minisclerotigenes]
MSAPQVSHQTLNAEFKGTARKIGETDIHQFRGIKYANIPARFERAEPVDNFNGASVDATQYGPRCPQAAVDVRHLLRIPEDFEILDEPEDEFECLNLDITCPPLSAHSGPLPVLIWIHGTDLVTLTLTSWHSRLTIIQVVLKSSPSARGHPRSVVIIDLITDPAKIVADSIEAKQPIIVVSINYRLNIFSFGDGKERNLALKDQRLGIDWVRKNIAAFGGNPDNITLSGESAGAVYVHAHLITGPPVKRAVLASGSLYLSSPLPVERGNGLIQALQMKVKDLGQPSLREASVSTLIQALKECNVNTMWIQEEPELENWETKPEQVDELMIGDTEYESVIWRNGVETLDGETITAAFEEDKEWGTKLRKLYQVVADRPTACKLGALDLVNDIRYTLPVEVISEKLAAANKRVYRYVFDQANPWQASSRAHHAVDLLYLFEGVDLSFNPTAEMVGQETRKRWIRFVSGSSPWSSEQRFAFGPVGDCKEISETQFAGRRRVNHLKVLREAGVGAYMPIATALTAGKISLLN